MFCVLAFVFRVFDFRLLSFIFCISSSMYVLAPPRRTRKRNWLVETYIPDKKRNAYSDIFPFSLPFLVKVV